MMRMLTIGLVLIDLFFFSCNKTGKEIYYFKAKVVETSDVSCDLPVLNFSEDFVRIGKLTKLGTVNYSVIKLPANFNIQDKKLYVSVAALTAEEDFPCNTLGINNPRLKILDVMDRQ